MAAASGASGLGAAPPVSGRLSRVVGCVKVGSIVPRLAGATVVGNLSVRAHMVRLPLRA